MVERTTIVMPPGLKRRATSRARAEGISFDELVRQAVEQRISTPPKQGKKKTKTGDPFWDNLVFYDGGPPDGSVNHDEYIYGGKKWSS